MQIVLFPLLKSSTFPVARTLQFSQAITFASTIKNIGLHQWELDYISSNINDSLNTTINLCCSGKYVSTVKQFPQGKIHISTSEKIGFHYWETSFKMPQNMSQPAEKLPFSRPKEMFAQVGNIIFARNNIDFRNREDQFSLVENQFLLTN